MRSLAPCLVVGLVLSALCSAPHALAGPAAAPPYVRTTLDDTAPPRLVNGPRHIRSTLDGASHVAFPQDAEGRLIRVSLESGAVTYAHLSFARSAMRRIRTSLD